MKKAVLLTILFLSLAFIALQTLPTAGAVPANQVIAISGPRTLIRPDPKFRQRYVPASGAFLKNRNSLEELATATTVVQVKAPDFSPYLPVILKP